MKFNMMKFIRKSMLISFMLGSSAFMFNNIYAATTSNSSSTKFIESSFPIQIYDPIRFSILNGLRTLLYPNRSTISFNLLIGVSNGNRFSEQ